MSWVGSELLEERTMKQSVTIIKRKARKTGSPVFTIKGARNVCQRQFVKHLVNEFRYLENSDCVYFLNCLAECLAGQLSQGNSVKIEELGTFKPTFREGKLNVNFLPASELKHKIRNTNVKIVSGGP